jgi:hypothetical protein
MNGECRVCGCTEAEPCACGCRWVEEDLCSVCALALEAIVSWGEVARKADIGALMRELLTMAAEGDSLFCNRCGAPITIKNAVQHVCPLVVVAP